MTAPACRYSGERAPRSRYRETHPPPHRALTGSAATSWRRGRSTPAGRQTPSVAPRDRPRPTPPPPPPGLTVSTATKVAERSASTMEGHSSARLSLCTSTTGTRAGPAMAAPARGLRRPACPPPACRGPPTPCPLRAQRRPPSRPARLLPAPVGFFTVLKIRFQPKFGIKSTGV